MKAEHRRELHTNALADRMGRLVQGMKQPPQGGTLVLWVIAGIALVTLGTWYFLSGTASWSSYWARLDGENQIDVLSAVASESQGTMPARAARFQRARVQLREGLRNLYSAEQRPAAISRVEQARQGFLELAEECKDSRLLAQEALVSAAQAEEALVGVPKSDDASASRGSLDRVLELYHQVARHYPGGYFADVANRRIKELESNPSAAESFYAQLNKLAEPKKP